MNILFIGDVFGTVGRHVLVHRLPSLVKEYEIDICIANGENAAGGIGITGNIFKKLRKYGVQVVTGGNHSFTYAESDSKELGYPELLRPANFPPGNIGKGSTLFTLENGKTVGVINLQGRVYFPESLDCPFRCGLELAEEMRKITPIIIVDFHAEASSEKAALAFYLDGKISALLGTHTHVQTADERILPGGTAFITDVGMTGPEDSVIGMKKEGVIKKFLLQTRVRLEPSDSHPFLSGVVISVNDETGRADSIRRIYERIPAASAVSE